jgi:hypothetical protein
VREQECDESRKEIFLGTKKSNIAKQRDEQPDTGRVVASGVKRSCNQECSDEVPATEETAARRKIMLRTIVEFLRTS